MVGSLEDELMAVVSVDVAGAEVDVEFGAGVQADTEVSDVVGCPSVAVSTDVTVTLSPAAVSDSTCWVAQPDTSVTITARTENQGLTIQSWPPADPSARGLGPH